MIGPYMIFLHVTTYKSARGNVVIKALGYKLEGSRPDEGKF
jgi:hypothetical protein